MLATQPSLTPHPHYNRRLFSDHYLDQVLPRTPEWKLGRDSASALLPQLQALYMAFVPSTNEAQTERELVRPVLELLGHHFEVQPALQTAAGTKRPDYVLYRDEEAIRANKNVVLSDTALQHAIAVADAKHWDRPLDQAMRVGVDPFTNKNPGYQITFYMQQGGLPWGILTNGRVWRLYHRDSAHKLDVFYEVELAELLERNDPAQLQYFLRFFERPAFEEGPLSLRRHLSESASYARSVGEGLREQVYEALLHVAQGFLDFPDNALTPEPDTLKRIYDNALILLYRLLFVLYAEARGLLPLEDSTAYRDDYSLHSIKRSVATSLRVGRHLLPSTRTLWPRLTELFRIIDAGSPPLKVATFNGGLFDPKRHAFLEQNSVGDAHLQQAIDKLARVEGEFIDYRDLSERHLGSIYEGLLEFHLQPLASDMSEDQAAAKEGWTAKLVTDKGERKATGSYYTPGFITRFMVEQAVGPVVDAALTEAAPRGPDAQAQAVLSINVLDCSMGSGHFLVEAADYIAHRMVEADLLPSDVRHPAGSGLNGGVPTLDELAYWRRRVAQSCIYGVDLNPLAVDLAKLSMWLATTAKDRPLSFLDHHLRPGNALVGARLSELRATGKAAARKGSTAARKVQKAEEAGQLSLASDSAFVQSMKQAVDNLWLIEDSPAETIGDVKSQEVLYEEVRRTFVQRYTQMLNLVAARPFGLEVDQAFWRTLLDHAAGRTLARMSKFDTWLNQAAALAERHRFFHWELEFPEVFFDRYGRPLGDEGGFDVVIGNPPYVRQERLAPLKSYLQAKFASFHGVADLYLYFYEQGLKLLRDGGRMAYISSGTFARANFAAAFRKQLPTLGRVEALVDFGENQPFEGAEMVRPSIVVLTRGVQDAPFRSLFIAAKVPESLDQALDREGIDCAPEALQQPEWTFQPAGNTRLLAKLLAAGRPLADSVGGRMYRGLLTGLTEAFVLDQATRDRLITLDPGCNDLIKPALRGEDLRPWYQEKEGRWMIVVPSGWTRRAFGDGLDERDAWQRVSSRYPGLAEHLTPFITSARKRLDQGEYWWELRACSYYDAFESPKILWPDISKLPRLSWDDDGQYINNTGFFLVPDGPHLLGLLQSRVLWFATSQVCQPLRLRAGLWQYRLFTQFMGRLPIPSVSGDERVAITNLTTQTTQLARTRYALHQQVRHRVQTDLGEPDKPLNQKLTAWWTLTFGVFRAEVQKVYKRDIPLAERGDWETWLADSRADHDRLTGKIVALETELNERVYRLFDLTADEIRIIEESTKYPYGGV
ncbi:MAG: Eco57I restriction-modification methylase domain-containing protein [Armatimonadota bacterium]